MPYVELATGAFGHNEADVRLALSHLSLPADLTGVDLTEFGFTFYEPSAPPTPAWNEQVVEVAPVDGVQQWALVPNGQSVPPRRLIRKSTVQERVIALGKIDHVWAVLDTDKANLVRWLAPDWGEVYADDEGLLAVLTAVGCTPEEIAAITG